MRFIKLLRNNIEDDVVPILSVDLDLAVEAILLTLLLDRTSICTFLSTQFYCRTPETGAYKIIASLLTKRVLRH